jgi:hypothetical protein
MQPEDATSVPEFRDFFPGTLGSFDIEIYYSHLLSFRLENSWIMLIKRWLT